MDYDKRLEKQFCDLVINLVKHDTSYSGFPCYIEVELGKTPKDKSQVALDLGNYIYHKTGLRYQSVPEYRGRGKMTKLRWFMSWDDIQPIRFDILQAYNKPESMLRHREYLPFEFKSLIIQNSARGVNVPDNN